MPFRLYVIPFPMRLILSLMVYRGLGLPKIKKLKK